MSRHSIADLATPYPIAQLLPSVIQEDEFAVRLTAAFDDVIAPVISVLDCLDSYVDPQLAPDDFVDWLADWVGTPLDDHWDDDIRRRSVLAAVSLHRLRGTVDGLRAVVALATGGAVEIVEPGGVAWAAAPTDDAGGAVDETERGLVVRVIVDDPDEVRLHALDELVAASKPAHLPHSIEVLSR
jgi:phage tail-like protein